jgi:hypothetical protein
MTLTKKEFIGLIEKTSFLHDRINGVFVPKDPQNEETSDRNLDRWKEIVAKGNEEIFEKRLSFDELTPDTARSLLGECCLSDKNNLPGWSDILEKILNPKEKITLEQITSGEKLYNRFLFPDNPVPFEEALAPFILVGREELIKKSGKSYTLADDRVHAVFEHSLLNSLIYLCLKAIHLEFSIFLLKTKAPFESFLDQLTDTK